MMCWSGFGDGKIDVSVEAIRHLSRDPREAEHGSIHAVSVEGRMVEPSRYHHVARKRISVGYEVPFLLSADSCSLTHCVGLLSAVLTQYLLSFHINQPSFQQLD